MLRHISSTHLIVPSSTLTAVHLSHTQQTERESESACARALSQQPIDAQSCRACRRAACPLSAAVVAKATGVRDNKASRKEILLSWMPSNPLLPLALSCLSKRVSLQQQARGKVFVPVRGRGSGYRLSLFGSDSLVVLHIDSSLIRLSFRVYEKVDLSATVPTYLQLAVAPAHHEFRNSLKFWAISLSLSPSVCVATRRLSFNRRDDHRDLDPDTQQLAALCLLARAPHTSEAGLVPASASSLPSAGEDEHTKGVVLASVQSK